jgi:glycerophosphoryl diester phosphodiesterase
MAKPFVIAHRGASNVAPENTLAAIEQAVALGADGVEVDVRATADGVPLLLHDATVDRTTDGAGDIEALSWAQVQRLDAGAWFEGALRASASRA